MYTFIIQENGVELERQSLSDYSSDTGLEKAQEKLDELQEKYSSRTVAHFEWIYPNGKGPKFSDVFQDELFPTEDCEDIVVIHLVPENTK